jgi:hypothetical protein
MSCHYVKLRRCLKSRLVPQANRPRQLGCLRLDQITKHIIAPCSFRGLWRPLRLLCPFISSLLSHDFRLAALIFTEALPESASERDLTPSD